MADGGSMDGKTVVITGGSSGIGKEAAIQLAAKGATVVITARDAGRGQQALDEVRSRSGGAAELVALDLASVVSIRSCSAELLERFSRIDVLVNNAGLVVGRRTVTEDGFETTFGVNHLGHFLLTQLLLERLVASAPSRVINVSSDAHSGAHGLDFDDLQTERGYRSMRAYSRSKLANILFTRELSRRLAADRVSVFALHPGVIRSGFARDGDAFLVGIGFRIIAPFITSPARGATTTVYLASEPGIEQLSGAYFVKGRPAPVSKWGADDDAARRLWDESEKLLAAAG